MASALLKLGRIATKTQILNKLKLISWPVLPSRTIFIQSKLCATAETEVAACKSKEFIPIIEVEKLSKQLDPDQTGNQGSMPILMPSLSPTMTEGTIVKWHKKEGDTVNPGDLLCDIQTDKAVVSMETEEEGILAKILKPDNSADLKVGCLIAVMVEEGDDWQNAEIPVVEEPSSSSSNEEPAPTITTTAATATPQTTAAPAGELHAEQLHQHGIGPSIRKLIEEYHVNINEIKGSGPQERLTKGDVMKHIQSKNLPKIDQSLAPQPLSPPPVSAPGVTPEFVAPPLPMMDAPAYIDIPNTGMRSTIAKRLTESKTTIPHSYATVDCNVGPVTQLRKQLTGQEVKVSVNDFIIKAAALALQRVPQVNSVWQGEEVHAMTNVDISVAVATKSGLITPIVKNTPYLSVDQISETVKDLATRAKVNQLQLHEFQGGTFTISNLGMYGISEFSAVINPPQTAIMAVGSSRVCVNEEGKPESRMSATLSYDARVMDDKDASNFLEVFRDIMENPQMTVVGSNLSRKLSAEL